MHEHGPNDLTGPVRGTSVWWHGTGAEPEPLDEGPVIPSRPKKVRRGPRRSGQSIRPELVARVRKEIAAGTYDTPARWEAALDRLLDRLARD
jgi:hypothetical protein